MATASFPFSFSLYAIVPDSRSSDRVLGKLIYQNTVAQSRGETISSILQHDTDAAVQWVLNEANDGVPYTAYRKIDADHYKVQVSKSVFKDQPVVKFQLITVSDLQSEQDVREQIFARVCHDLRTPLQGIVGLSEQEAMDRKNVNEIELMETIKHEGQRLAFLIQDILDALKLKQKKAKLKMSMCNLHGIVETVVSSLRGAPTLNKNVELKHTVEPHRVAMCDQFRLEQILYNLVGNACKFTASGEITISARPAGDKFIELVVTDTGRGIKPQHLGMLFEEFAKVPVDEDADDGDTDQPRGTGLGLAICKELVALHGGEIHVDSTYGKGSCFRFTLQTTPAHSFSVFDDDDSDASEQQPDYEELVKIFGQPWGTGSFRYGTGGLRYSKIKSLIDFDKPHHPTTATIGVEGLTDEAMSNFYSELYPEWYVGNMSRPDAIELLSGCGIGTFLVRRGTIGPTITVRYIRIEEGFEKERVFNVEISRVQEYGADGKKISKFFISEHCKHNDLSALVIYYMHSPASFFNNLAEGRPHQNEKLIPVHQHW
eukprot:m.148827 g.148827  ORF g.148827 m.148827 type:complete len:544 (+) comp30624_c0_seq1:228-1859(+)